MTINADKEYEVSFPKLAKEFSLKSFQTKVVNNVCTNGSTVAIMPTGGGKSLIYWLAGKTLKGITIVVSPLIALIDEQAEKLRSHNCTVLVFHAGIKPNEQLNQLKDLYNCKITPDFLFVSPERIATDGFLEFCLIKRKEEIRLFVIDEIHCVSQWGFDFRPFYKRIPDFLSRVFDKKWPRILGLTATINPKELKDISTDFKIDPNYIFKDEVLLRFDVKLNVEKYSKEDDKEKRLWELLEENKKEKVLVYLYRKYYKRGVEDLCDKAIKLGFKAVAFHGDMTGGDRQDILNDFRKGIKNIVFATNAFGMGIDISDIRIVIHFMMPESVEEFYQEIGRAGRDQLGATSYVLYTNKNIQVRRTHFIDKSFPKTDDVIRCFRKITNNEIGKKTLQYFQDEEIQDRLAYFLDIDIIKIIAKGFTDLKVFESVKNKEIEKILLSSKTGMVIPILNKPAYSKIQVDFFFGLIYKALVVDEVKMSKPFNKCLIIDVFKSDLAKAQLSRIENDISKKREYKHNLFDYLVYLLDNYEDSIKLHQEIGRYLGIDKHKLNKIYKTESGIWVRSKSEVIISNILFRSGIKFSYEEKLFYDTNKWIEPDFKIIFNGKTWYWEHLGLLGDDEYDHRWQFKKSVYQRLGIKNLILTEESSVLSDIVNQRVKVISK